jgi:DNA-binding response OmpR family regulator
MSTTVLVADGEPAALNALEQQRVLEQRRLLERSLRHDGFEIVAGGRPDLVIASDDAELEHWFGEVPVIVLGSPEAEADDRVLAFRRGCDDYLPRPFHYEELLERIRAVLRRAQPPSLPVVLAGSLEIDLRSRIVSVRGTPVALAAKEYALVVKLASDPTRVFTKAELLRDIWGYAAAVRTRTLDSHTSRLRRKLSALDPETSFIENEWGVGYRLLGPLPRR